MFSAVTTRAERDQIGERARSCHGMVDGEPLGGAAANAPVVVTEPHRSPQLLQGVAVELGPRGARALGPLACVAPASCLRREDCAAPQTNMGQTIPFHGPKAISNCRLGPKILAVIDISEAYGSVWTSQARLQSRLSARAKGSRAFSRAGSPRALAVATAPLTGAASGRIAPWKLHSRSLVDRPYAAAP